MKKSKNLFIILGIVVALVIGFLIGISVDYPELNNNVVSGTIGKVNNYRNTKATEADIELKNEISLDSTKQEMLKIYLKFYYLTAAKTSSDLQFTICEANDVEAFKESNQSQIDMLDNYEKFLSSVRPDLLSAFSICQEPEKIDPLLLKDMLNHVDNIIAQLNYRSRTVFEFINQLASFIETNKTQNIQGLMRAHDLLMLNQINSAIVTSDKLVLKSFDKKTLLTNMENEPFFNQHNLNNMLKQDIEKLGANDMEILGITLDAEKLSVINDMEELGTNLILDAETLGSISSDVIFSDSEMLGFNCLACWIN